MTLLRPIFVVLLWLFAFPLAILYHLLAARRPKTYRPGTPAYARIVASAESAQADARLALARRRGDEAIAAAKLDRSPATAARLDAALRALRASS
jgi:hypothetical protein